MYQRVKEIEAESDGDDQADDWLSHGATLLKLPESARVDAHEHQNPDAERNEHHILHVSLRPES
jgi:hypothetical protein